MNIRTGKVTSMWIENDRPEIGLAIVCPAALGYSVTVVHEPSDAASYRHLGEILQVDIDSGKIIRH